MREDLGPHRCRRAKRGFVVVVASCLDSCWNRKRGDLRRDPSGVVEAEYRREGTCRSVVLWLILKGLF